MPNPFDDPGSDCLGLVDDGGRHSVWSAFAAALDGWTGSRRWR
ncbi:MbtH family NRPS accessory protein [Streptomyces sp. NPDC006529]